MYLSLVLLLFCSYLCVAPVLLIFLGFHVQFSYLLYFYISGVALRFCRHSLGFASVHCSYIMMFPLLNVHILGVASVLCLYTYISCDSPVQCSFSGVVSVQSYYLCCCPCSVHIPGVAYVECSYLLCCPWSVHISWCCPCLLISLVLLPFCSYLRCCPL
jgi:hypothetical protein